MLAAEFTSHEVNVRYKQYAHIHDEFNRAFFEEEEIEQLVRDNLGFTLSDFEAVRDGIREIYIDGLEKCRNDLGDVTQAWVASDRTRQSESDVQRGSEAASDLLFYPGKRAAFTISEVVARLDIASPVATKIAELFSQEFAEPSDPVKAVQEFLDGKNPFARAALLVDNHHPPTCPSSDAPWTRCRRRFPRSRRPA